MPFFVQHSKHTEIKKKRNKNGAAAHSLMSLQSFLTCFLPRLASSLSVGSSLLVTGTSPQRRMVESVSYSSTRQDRQSSALLLSVPRRPLTAITAILSWFPSAPQGQSSLFPSSHLQLPCYIPADWQMDLNKLGHRISPGEGTESVG